MGWPAIRTKLPTKASIFFHFFETLAKLGNFDEKETPSGQRDFEKMGVVMT